MKLVTSQRFDKDLRKLLKKNPKYKSVIHKTLKLLLANFAHPSLRLHKLSGFQNYSISVDMKIRIIISLEKGIIYLLRIGTHEQVY